MRKIITKRNYSFLIGLILHFFILLSIKIYYCNILNNIETQLLHINYETQSSHWNNLNNLQSEYRWLFGITYFITFCISALFMIGDAIFRKIYIFIIYALLMLLVAYFPFFGKASVHVYEPNSFYYIFFPLIFYVYYINRDVIEGIKEDKTDEIKNKIETKLENSISDLTKLLEMELITQEEYNEKKEFRIKEKIRTEIKDSVEYSLLFTSKQKGLITEVEFNTKVENLVSKKSRPNK